MKDTDILYRSSINPSISSDQYFLISEGNHSTEIDSILDKISEGITRREAFIKCWLLLPFQSSTLARVIQVYTKQVSEIKRLKKLPTPERALAKYKIEIQFLSSLGITSTDAFHKYILQLEEVQRQLSLNRRTSVHGNRMLTCGFNYHIRASDLHGESENFFPEENYILYNRFAEINEELSNTLKPIPIPEPIQTNINDLEKTTGCTSVVPSFKKFISNSHSTILMDQEHLKERSRHAVRVFNYNPQCTKKKEKRETTVSLQSLVQTDVSKKYPKTPAQEIIPSGIQKRISGLFPLRSRKAKDLFLKTEIKSNEELESIEEFDPTFITKQSTIQNENDKLSNSSVVDPTLEKKYQAFIEILFINNGKNERSFFILNGLRHKLIQELLLKHPLDQSNQYQVDFSSNDVTQESASSNGRPLSNLGENSSIHTTLQTKSKFSIKFKSQKSNITSSKESNNSIPNLNSQYLSSNLSNRLSGSFSSRIPIIRPISPLPNSSVHSSRQAARSRLSQFQNVPSLNPNRPFFTPQNQFSRSLLKPVLIKTPPKKSRLNNSLFLPLGEIHADRKSIQRKSIELQRTHQLFKSSNFTSNFESSNDIFFYNLFELFESLIYLLIKNNVDNQMLLKFCEEIKSMSQLSSEGSNNIETVYKEVEIIYLKEFSEKCSELTLQSILNILRENNFLANDLITIIENALNPDITESQQNLNASSKSNYEEILKKFDISELVELTPQVFNQHTINTVVENFS